MSDFKQSIQLQLDSTGTIKTLSDLKGPYSANDIYTRKNKNNLENIFLNIYFIKFY